MKSFPKLKRLKDFVIVFIRYGLASFIPGPIFSMTGIRRQTEEGVKYKDMSVGKRLRLAMEELGTTFIKFGQLLSLHEDVVSNEIAEELKKLQDEIHPLSLEEMNSVIENNFPGGIGTVFSEFRETPLASASISQVYEARLRSEDEEVVIKIRKPGVVEKVQQDIDILFFVADIMNKRSFLSDHIDLVSLVEEFHEIMKEELDLKHEAKNIRNFRKNFIDEEWKNVVVFPILYETYCSSSVIVMEKFEGYKIKHLGKEYELTDDDRKVIAENGARVFWKQVFMDGFFHADLHSGNIIFMSDRLIGLIDCGLAGKLNPYLKEKTAEMFVAMATKDYLKLASVCIELNKGKKSVDRKNLSFDMKALLENLPDSLGDMNSAKLMNDILNIVRRNSLKLPSELLRLAKAVSLVEGFGKTLYPDFNIIEESHDMAASIIREQYSPERLLDDAVKIISHLRDMSMTLPINISEILEKIERGNLRLKLDLTILSEERKFLSKMVTRICMAFIVTGSMLSMSLFKDGDFFYFSMIFFIFFLVLFFISFRKG